MAKKFSQRLREQANTFSKLKSAVEIEAKQRRKQAEVMAEVCEGLCSVCLMLAQYVEGKGQSEKIDIREIH